VSNMSCYITSILTSNIICYILFTSFLSGSAGPYTAQETMQTEKIRVYFISLGGEDYEDWSEQKKATVMSAVARMLQKEGEVELEVLQERLPEPMMDGMAAVAASIIRSHNCQAALVEYAGEVQPCTFAYRLAMFGVPTMWPSGDAFIQLHMARASKQGYDRSTTPL
jgi:hypothetical protein